MTKVYRGGSRIPLEVDVVLSYPPLGLLRGRTRNISTNGIFVHMGPIMQLYPGIDVEVIFTLRRDKTTTSHRFQGQVTRVTADGAGIRFAKTAESFEHTIPILLQAYSPELGRLGFPLQPLLNQSFNHTGSHSTITTKPQPAN